jgi:signal transduction histidine kinase
MTRSPRGAGSAVTFWVAGSFAPCSVAALAVVSEPEPSGGVLLIDDKGYFCHVPQQILGGRWPRCIHGSESRAEGRRRLASHDRRGKVTARLKSLSDPSGGQDARDALEAMNVELEHRVAERTRALTEANEKLKTELHECELVSQSQKMEALRQLTGGVAHDFNNLLTAILGGLEVTRRRIDDPRSIRLIDSSISAAQRGARLIAQLLAFARMQNLRPSHLQLNALVRDMQELLEQSVGASVGLAYDLADDVWPVMADADQVRMSLVNLAINARDAMPDGGTVRIGSRNICVNVAEIDLAAGEYATLTVQDNGTGMAEAVQKRLFEPFFTTKDVGQGSGLGLAQVYGFVRQSGGTVRVHSVAGEGTTVTILLPRASTVPGD